MPGNCIPDVFVDFCKEAASSTTLPEDLAEFNPTVEITVKLGTKDLTNLKIVQKLTNTFKRKLLTQLLQNEIKINCEINETTCSTSNRNVQTLDSINSCSISSLNIDDSGLPETLISESEDTLETVTESNMETQPPHSQTQEYSRESICEASYINQSQDLF